MDGGQREAEHGKVDHKESSDDEEVELLSHRKGAGGTDLPGTHIRDTPDMSDAQREEWLIKTEPLQGARPRWEEDGRPQWYLIRRGLLTWSPPGGGGISRKVEQRYAPTPMLPPEQRILQEEEVITPPRKEAHRHEGHRAPEPQLPPGGIRVVPQIFLDVRARDVGPDRWSGSVQGTC